MPYQFKIKDIKNKKLVAVLFISTVLIIILIFSSNRKKPGSYYKTVTDNKNADVSKSLKDEQSEDSSVTKLPIPETRETNIEQISDDYEFAKYWDNIYREYPWYKKLPVVTDNYKIYWVIQEKSFRIRLTVSENSPEEQKKDFVNKALKDIEELTGVSYENYPYYVLYTENKK